MADRHLQNSNRNNQFNLLKTDITDSNSVTQRKDIENFIHRRFAESYDANIRQFMPILLCLKDQSSSPRAALGLRPASNEKLFLENYLDQPVEKLLSSMANKTVSRSEIIEVGNLAISEKGDARALIIAMTSFLSSASFKWVCFTIGPILINSFTRLGLNLIDLGPAHIEMLHHEEQAAWGSYYTQKPRVMAGSINHAREFLVRNSLHEMALSSLWQQAQQIGAKAA